MKPSRKILGSLMASFLPTLAKAFWQISLSIIVVIIGGIVVYQLVRVCKTLLPTPPPQNNQVGGLEQIIDYTNPTNGLPLISYITINSMVVPFFYMEPQSTETSEEQNGGLVSTKPAFMFEYGLDGNIKPWAMAGSNLPANSQVTVQAVVSRSNAFSFYLTTKPGATFFYSVTNTTDPGSSSYDLMVTNNTNCFSSSVTNSAGDVAQASIETPQTVVIERTSDLASWQPIYTNQIATNTVEIFTDSNPPPNNGFYRVRIP